MANKPFFVPQKEVDLFDSMNSINVIKEGATLVQGGSYDFGDHKVLADPLPPHLNSHKLKYSDFCSL